MTKFSEKDYEYMRRALQLARGGCGHVSPNPMVGAVIVDPSGRIIGEGWHRKFGEAHAEVNAVRSVQEKDRGLLKQSTIYVTLEPCSHYGKTPPCARLLIETGFSRVVVAVGDPNPKVSGRGVSMICEAGIQVDEGLLADEAYELNRPFMTAHRCRRPFVTLKWAQSRDGFMDRVREAGEKAAMFSTPISSQLVHKRRGVHDAIAVGAGTILADNPRLDVRHIAGRSPKPVIFDRHNIVNEENCGIFKDAIHIKEDLPLQEILHKLYSEHGVKSLLVEGGPNLLGGFISAGLWDEAYVEISPSDLAERGASKAPTLSSEPVRIWSPDGRNRVNFYLHYGFDGVKNI